MPTRPPLLIHLVALWLLALPGLGACKHGPTAQEQERAAAKDGLGAAALGAGHYREALGHLLEAAQLDPDNAELQYHLGICYLVGFGRLDDAEKHLKRATELQENYSDAYNALGNLYLARNRCDLAIPVLEKAKSNLLWPTPHMAEQNLGWCLYKTGKTEAGIAHLKSAVNLSPTACGAYDYLAEIYIETAREPESVPWLERYLKFCDTDQVRKYVSPSQLANVFYRLGNAYLKQDKRDQARQSFAACAERFPEEPLSAECKKNLALLP